MKSRRVAKRAKKDTNMRANCHLGFRLNSAAIAKLALSGLISLAPWRLMILFVPGALRSLRLRG
jgi:hypothetical protein